MTERYRKWGRTVRFERDSVVHATERGEAIEDGARFHARPLNDDIEIPDVAEDVEAFAKKIRSLIDVQIERLIVTAGVTEHDFEGIRWRETSARVHIDINNGHQRTKLDLGGNTLADIRLDDVRISARALAHVSGQREQPESCVIAPHVSAVLLPIMGLKLMQTSRGRDGKGAEIEELVLDHPPFPNWFRPSYRVRPVRMPFHMRVDDFGTIPANAPRIVALLSAGQVLCDDGASVFAMTIRIDQVKAAGPPAGWYPHLAGTFGHEILL